MAIDVLYIAFSKLKNHSSNDTLSHLPGRVLSHTFIQAAVQSFWHAVTFTIYCRTQSIYYLM